MADYSTRAKQIVANIKSKEQLVPGNTFLLDLGKAFVYGFQARWSGFIGSEDNKISSNVAPVTTQINPANLSDPTDIGEYNNDTGVFTGLTSAQKNKLYAVFFIREMRSFCRDILLNYRFLTDTLTASEAGKKLEEAKSVIKTKTQTESSTELGDPKNDPES